MIWVVDDSRAVAESLTFLLIASGLPAEAITSGRETLERLIAGDIPDLIVLDLRMAGANGNDVLAEIVSRPEWQFPVIISTGWEEGLSKELMERVSAILPKTIDPNKMLEFVRGALEISAH